MDKHTYDVTAEQAADEYPELNGEIENDIAHGGFMAGAQWFAKHVGDTILSDLAIDPGDWENDDLFRAVHELADMLGRLPKGE